MIRRQGLTLVEVIVAVAIASLVMAIALPAIQLSRASARRVYCGERLRQVGLASHGFCESFGYFPTTKSGDHFYDLLGRMEGPSRRENDTLSDSVHQLAMFDCPADVLDRWRPGESAKSVSFALNNGTHFRLESTNPNGFEPVRGQRRPSDITDGLSMTAAYSERLRVDTSVTLTQMSADRLRYTVWLPHRVPVIAGAEGDMVSLCRATASSGTPSQIWWTEAASHGYDHHLPPNSWGCLNATPAEPNYAEGVIPASSLHSGGVNVLMADGHVRFTSDVVDGAAWQSAGSINGNERGEF